MGRKFLITLFLLMILYGAYYWGIPAVIGLGEKADLIEKTIFNKYGYKIDIENLSLKMGLLPSVCLKADNFALLNDNNSHALSIEKPKINIKLLPLIFKSIDIKHFSANNIEVNIVFDEDSKLKLGQYAIEPSSSFKLKHASIFLEKYKINLEDKIQSKKLSADGKHLTINNFENNKHFNLSTKADIQTGKNKTFIQADMDLKLPLNKIADNQCNISGRIINLDLADFSVYAQALSNNSIKSMSGIINLTAYTEIASDKQKQIKTSLYINNLGIFKDSIDQSIYFKDKLELKTDITTVKNGIDINKMTISGKGINTALSGQVTKLNTKLPDLNLKAAIDNSRVENIITLLPGEPDLCPDVNLLLLKQTVFKGDVIGNLEIKGKADTPDVYGNLLISNAYMVKPIKNAEKAVIKIAFIGDKLNLDVKVPTAPDQIVRVKGPITLYKEKYADLIITSTNNVDLKTAQIVLNPLHDILLFDIGPVPIMDINGKGGINLHVTGTRKNPYAWGQFYFNNANVSFIDIKNMTLTNGSGTLDFENQNTLFQTKSANLNGKPVSVKGTYTLLGELDFNVIAKGQNLEHLLRIIKTSPMLEDIQKLTEQIENGSGLVNLNINLTGKVKDPRDVVFNKNLFAKGKIEMLSDTIKLKEIPVPLSKISGMADFDNLNADFELKSNLNNSQIKIDGKIKNNKCNINFLSNKFNLGDVLKTLPESIKLPYKNELAAINTSFTGKYNGDIQNINYNNIYLKGNIYSNKDSKSEITVEDSSFELKNSGFKLPELKGTLKNIPYYISLNVSDMFSPKRIVNGNCEIESFDLNILNDSALQSLFPPENTLKNIEFLNGKVNLAAHVKNNNLNAFSSLDDLSILYKPKNMKLTINSGNILLKNNILNLSKINAKLGQMPLFIDGKISNIKKNPYYNLYINAKPTQDFFDQFINNNALYPVKLKGDAILTSKASGTADNFNTKSTFDIAENSSLYYMGASIGDIENPVRINVDNTYFPDKIRINSLQYDKIISSQNNKPFTNTQLTASGSIRMLDNNIIGFDNFKVKTQTPTDAKIFNIIFRKPFMKQGVFTSDIVLNGTALIPIIRGTLDITSIDIPFFDSTIRDVNLDFKNDKIIITSKGTVLTNDVYLELIMKNNLAPPYIVDDVNLKLANLDINKITDTIRDLEAESIRQLSISSSSNTPNVDIPELVIQKANIEAGKIKVRNINADNFKAQLNLNKDGLLNVNNFKFEIAEGSVSGNFKYNIKSHITDLDITLDRANASIMSEALFDLKGQVYGNVNGSFNLNCTGGSQDNCFKTLSGSGKFKVADGRMPKLGSLEYLLKAGNLLRGGFTGLSINSIIDIVTPLKTGDFESIYGDMNIAGGIADRINIYSKGHDLNMYMTGSYNIVTSIAEMSIYGSLSKNITTVFGKIKNASLNTLFNTIPGISDSTEKLIMQKDIGKIPNIKDATNIYRIFFVDINGDINGENYVKSFKWVK